MLSNGVGCTINILSLSEDWKLAQLCLVFTCVSKWVWKRDGFLRGPHPSEIVVEVYIRVSFQPQPTLSTMERWWLILRRIETDGNNASCWHDEKLKQVETMLLKSSFKFYICENPFGEKSVQSFPCPYLASHTGSRWKAQPGPVWLVQFHTLVLLLGDKNRGRSGSFVTPQKRHQDEVAPAFGRASP